MTKINEIWHVVSIFYGCGLFIIFDRVGFWVGKKKGEGPFQREYFLGWGDLMPPL